MELEPKKVLKFYANGYYKVGKLKIYDPKNVVGAGWVDAWVDERLSLYKDCLQQ